MPTDMKSHWPPHPPQRSIDGLALVCRCVRQPVSQYWDTDLKLYPGLASYLDPLSTSEPGGAWGELSPRDHSA